jgi:NAD(P)-dependent dehydrogenase (short-subunit alcohol dehydrogenase family)
LPSDAKIALVTGANSGFGRLISIALAMEGYRIFGGFRGTRDGFDTQARGLAAAAAEHDVTIESVRLDVTDDGSVGAAVREVVDRAERIDLLVNCAGFGLMGPFENTSIDQARRVLETNLFGTMRMAKAVVPVMREHGGGTILNFGSDIGVHANFFQSAYAPSKFAVEALSMVMRWELQQFGIRVAVISPGWYGTEFGESVVSTFEAGPQTALYAPLVAAWEAGVSAVEGPNMEPQQVADAVVRILKLPELPFRTPVGWNPVRSDGINPQQIDDYERRLFAYYRLASFRGSWAGDGES